MLAEIADIVWFILGGFALLLLLAGLLIWRVRSEEEITSPPPPPPAVSAEERFAEFQAGVPRYSDLIPGEITKGSFSTQLQTDSYNIRIEDVKGQVRYVVNGVSYNSLREIPSSEHRAMAKKLFQKTFQIARSRGRATEVIRQVLIGNQATIEFKSESGNVSVQRQGGETRYIVNGQTYYSLKEIPDLDMQRMARELISKMV